MYLKKELYELIRTDESIFDFLQESALDGLWYWDLENPENEWMNPRFWTVLGYNPDDMPHKSTAWQSIINQDDLKTATDNFTRHCENPDHPYDQIVRYTHKDGSSVWIRCRGLAIRDNNGKPIRMLGAHQDVSDLKKSEQALLKANKTIQESESRFSALFSSMSEMVVLHELVFDDDSKPVNYRITDCNDAFTKITGITRKIAVGALSTDLYGTKEPPYLKEFSETVFTGVPYHYETYFQPMDRHFSISVISPGENQFATVTNDITELIKAKLLLQERNEEITAQNEEITAQNEELNQANLELIAAKEKAEEGEDNLRFLFENMTQGVVYHKPSGDILRANQAAARILGLSLDQLYGKTSLDPRWKSIHEDRTEYRGETHPAQITIKTKKAVRNSIMGVYIPEKNDYSWININSIPRFNNKNELIQIVVTFEDITEIKKAKEKAEESDRLKSAFLANMSHEIRTPMNGILGFAELLKNPELNDNKQQEFISIIQKSGARMLSIINDIIDISKIEAGLMKLDVEETNINEQIEYIYTFFKPEVEAKGMKLMFKTTLSAQEATIKTDREKVYAILTNLVKNAIKYSKEGTIEVGYKKEGENLEFYVKDTGTGIPKERQQSIFERFIQADTEDKMAPEGAGLGLSITKAYLEMLGGKIWVESEEGIGSTFYFTLPYITEPIKETADQQLDASDKIDPARKLKILIGEDDEASELLLKEKLATIGKEVLIAKTGADAVESCRNNPDIDLILMDIRMPEMGGYEATGRIREFNKEVVIIAQTAYGLSGDREKAIEAGCNDYISKPIGIAELLALIQKYFG